MTFLAFGFATVILVGLQAANPQNRLYKVGINTPQLSVLTTDWATPPAVLFCNFFWKISLLFFDLCCLFHCRTVVPYCPGQGCKAELAMSPQEPTHDDAFPELPLTSETVLLPGSPSGVDAKAIVRSINYSINQSINRITNQGVNHATNQVFNYSNQPIKQSPSQATNHPIFNIVSNKINHNNQSTKHAHQPINHWIKQPISHSANQTTKHKQTQQPIHKSINQSNGGSW